MGPIGSTARNLENAWQGSKVYADMIQGGMTDELTKVCNSVAESVKQASFFASVQLVFDLLTSTVHTHRKIRCLFSGNAILFGIRLQSNSLHFRNRRPSGIL